MTTLLIAALFGFATGGAARLLFPAASRRSAAFTYLVASTGSLAGITLLNGVADPAFIRTTIAAAAGALILTAVHRLALRGGAGSTDVSPQE